MLDEIRAMDWVPRSLRQKSTLLTKTCALLEERLKRHPSDEEIAAELDISLNHYYRLLDEIKGISLMPWKSRCPARPAGRNPTGHGSGRAISGCLP